MISELLTPDAYDIDWYGWVTNQAGHFVLGLIIAAIVRGGWIGVIATLSFAVMIEIAQGIGAGYLDSATDVLFTVLGALFYMSSSASSLYLVTGAFLIGAMSRYGKR